MTVKYYNNYNKPCKKISWKDLHIGDYFFLQLDGLCLKISATCYFNREHNKIVPILDSQKDNLGEVKVEVHWEKVFEEMNKENKE